MGLKSLALPAISSGVFGFPKDICAQSFMEEVLIYAEKKSHQKLDSVHRFAVKPVTDIRFTNIDDETVEHFITAFDKHSAHFEVVPITPDEQ